MLALLASEAGRIASAVTGDRLDSLPAELLVRSGLAPLAYVTGAVGSEGREVVEAFARATMQHRTVRAELASLLAAWAQAGVRPLLFKGFHLAEWVYRQPGQRPYGDVDVLLDPAEAPAAEEVARAAGWRVPWTRRDSATPYKHEEMQLVSPSGVTQLDVHRFAVHCASPLDRVQRRVTAAVWRAAREERLDGAPVLVLRPEDAVLVGLVLNRFWSPDDLTPKPQDFYDLQALVRSFDLSPDDLAGRARELGCARTWRLFRSRCDPWRRRLFLHRPGLLVRHAYLAQIALERPHPVLEDVMMRVPGILPRPSARRGRGAG